MKQYNSFSFCWSCVCRATRDFAYWNTLSIFTGDTAMYVLTYKTLIYIMLALRSVFRQQELTCSSHCYVHTWVVVSHLWMETVYTSYGLFLLKILWRLGVLDSASSTHHVDHCSGSLEPESSCHDRDWIMELPMEADILIFTGILTPEDASVASCLPRLCRSFCGCPRCGAALI